MGLFHFVLQRELIIALAIFGAAIATLGSHLMRRASTSDARLAKIVLRLGYGITLASVALFVAAGFWGGG